MLDLGPSGVYNFVYTDRVLGGCQTRLNTELLYMAAVHMSEQDYYSLSVINKTSNTLSLQFNDTLWFTNNNEGMLSCE